MITKFIDRENELEALDKEYKKQNFTFFPIYGRRRIGKTELIKQFIENKPHIYFLATEGTEKENILNFKNAAQNIIDLSSIKDDFETIFKYITKNMKDKQVIVIDEYPFLVKSNKAISSNFQRIIDQYLSKSNIFLILCGSSVGMMYKEVLGYKAPLYGRRTGQIELDPFSFEDVVNLLNKSLEECIEIYGICGGVPFYLKEFVEKKDFFKLVEEKVLSKEALLNKEVIFILREELDEISRYASIINAIALGNTKMSEIMNQCGFKERLNITPYLNVLERLGIVKKEVSITSGKRARGIYKIKDNFFKFYFRFVRPNESILEDKPKGLLNEIKKDYNKYIGEVFESISKEFLMKKYNFSKIGRWWHKDKEIDIVGIDQNSKKIMFFEIKWKKLSLNQSFKILSELQEKSEFVNWSKNKTKQEYGIIAKKIEDKNILQDKGFYAYDLDDWR